MNKSPMKYLALAVPVLAISLWPFPASGVEGRGTPSAADYQETDTSDSVFCVVLPVDTSHVFDFIMDPEGLIEKTKAAAYGGLQFEEGATLFFRRNDGEEEAYSSRSDSLTILNRGEDAVKVVVTASISSDTARDLIMTDDREFTDNTGPGLYLALADGERVSPMGVGEEAYFEVIVEDSYSFWLTGAVSRTGDWSEWADTAPVVTVTWKILPLEEEYGEMMEESGTPGNAGKILQPGN